MSEVLNHHISRTVDDWCMLKHLRDDRDVFVIEVLSVDLKEDGGGGGGGQDAHSLVGGDGNNTQVCISSYDVRNLCLSFRIFNNYKMSLKLETISTRRSARSPAATPETPST